MITHCQLVLIFGVLVPTLHQTLANTRSSTAPCNANHYRRTVKPATQDDLERLRPEPTYVLSAYSNAIGVPYLVLDDQGPTLGVERNLQCLQDKTENGAICFTKDKDTIKLNGILSRPTEDIVIQEHRKLGMRKLRKSRPEASSEDDHALNNVLERFSFSYQNLNPLHTRDVHLGSDIINATVEILVWTDFSFYKSFQRLAGHSIETEREILRYIATLVNAADLRIKKGLSRDPSINVALVLSGVVICKTSNCSWFIDNYKINDTIDNHVALNHFAEALKMDYLTKFSFRYDYAAVLTRLDVTDPNGYPIGVAFADDICQVKEGKSSAVVEDQGAYSSVGTFVHELAHTLGSDHDGWFRSINCSSADGYIMSTLSPLTKNGFFFSNCSIQSIKENLRRPNASCVFDNPVAYNAGTSLTDILPGQIYNATQQCNQLYGTKFCLSIGTQLEDICYKMYCWDPVLPNVCSTKSPAALGTSCGPQKWCVGGECVYDQQAPHIPNIAVG